MKKDYYNILGVSKEASHDEIKAAYRKLAKQYHPDVKITGDEEKFKEINEAWEILGDEEKRKNYDNPVKFGSNEFIDNIFQNFFHSHHQEFYDDSITIDLNLTLEEIYSGTSKDIKYEIKEPCKYCKGNGVEEYQECPTCKGKQYVNINSFIRMPCGNCSGEGKIFKTRCKVCSGTGKSLESKQKILKFNISQGQPEGYITLRDKENKCNVILNISYIKHAYFICDYPNIFIEYPITLDEILNRDKKRIEFTYLNNEVMKVKIPKNHNICNPLVMNNFGFNIPNTNKKGSLVIKFKLLLDEENNNWKKLANKLANYENKNPCKEKLDFIKKVF